MPRNKKVKVNREAATAMAVIAPSYNKRPPAWLRDCPLQDEDPLLDDWDQPSLAPGAALEACSGSDIYFQKASSKKSKYLVFLPGLMAFDHGSKSRASITTSTNTPKPTSCKTEEEEDSQKPPASDSFVLTQETMDSTVPLTQESSATVESAVKGTSTPAKKTSDSNALALGQIRGLRSSTSTTLTLPLDENRSMEFRGHKVSTSSKFIVLTLQPKKGLVICKDVFSSAIVFGNPTEIVTSQTEKADESVNNKIDMDASIDEENDDDQIKISSSAGEEKEVPPPLEHYGGSCRAWDGSMQGKVSNRTIPAASTSVKKKTTLVKDDKRSSIESEEEKEEMSEGESTVDSYHIDLSNSSPVTQRRPPRRQSRKRVRYAENDENDDSGSEDEESEMSSKEKTKTQKDDVGEVLIGSDDDRKKKFVKRKPAPKRSSTKTPARKSIGNPKKGITFSEKGDDSASEEIIMHDDDDDKDFVMETTKPIGVSNRRTSGRASSRKRPSTQNYESSLEDDLGKSDNVEASKDSKKKGRKHASKSEKAAAKVTADSDSAIESNDSDAEEIVKTVRNKDSTKSLPRHRRRRASNMNTKVSEVNARAPINLSDGESSIEIVEVCPSASKKRKKKADSDSDSSFELAPSVKRKLASQNVAVTSAQNSPASGRTTKSSFEKKRGEGENADSTNVESNIEGLDGKSMKSMLAKAISKGKAARPSHAKPDQNLEIETTSPSPFGTPSGRRRRAHGKSPAKSVTKPTIRNLADDDEYTFL